MSGYEYTDDEGNFHPDNEQNYINSSKNRFRATYSDQPISVLQAKRIHSGYIKVIGKIVTKSEMYVLDVEDKGKHLVYRDARFIQLEDIEKLDENERLGVILYDDLIENVVAGEIVEIEGIV